MLVSVLKGGGQKKEKARILYTFRKQLGTATGLRGLWHEGARENKWKIGVQITFLFLRSNPWRKTLPDFISHVGKVCEVRAASVGEGEEPEMPRFYLSTTPGSRGKLGENWHGSVTHKACPQLSLEPRRSRFIKVLQRSKAASQLAPKVQSNTWASGWH